MRTVGIVLAAGKSKRFGPEDKLLASYKRKTLCSYAAEAMRNSDVDAQVACISNLMVEPHFDDFDIVTCDGGQSDSLKRGLARAIELNADRVLLSLADMPHITAEVLNRLLAVSSQVAACQNQQGPHTVPALFSRELFPELMQLTGDRGARSLLRSRTGLETIEITEFQAFDVDVQTDLNRGGA